MLIAHIVLLNNNKFKKIIYYSAQTQMVGSAKSKVENVEEQLKQARVDFDATQEAAQKASSSAQEAQNNANEAAGHAATAGAGNYHDGTSGGGGGGGASSYQNQHDASEAGSQVVSTSSHSQKIQHIPSHSSSHGSGPQTQAHASSASESDYVASNHNYGEFKPSNQQFSFSGY